MSYRRSVVCLLAGLLLAAAAPPGLADDADMRARIAAAGDAEEYDADVVVVVDWTDVLVRPNGIGTARRHRVVKVLRDAGIRNQSVQVFPFDPNTNRLDLVARTCLSRRRRGRGDPGG